MQYAEQETAFTIKYECLLSTHSPLALVQLPHETATVSGGEDPVCDALGLVSGVSIDALAGQHGCGTTLDAGVDLRGIWPNTHGRGITRGSLFALALLARTHVWQGDVARKSTD